MQVKLGDSDAKDRKIAIDRSERLHDIVKKECSSRLVEIGAGLKIRPDAVLGI